jgi:large subunit ribosomal protein L6
MSRLGKTPLAIPTGVTVTQSGKLITVKGPKGELSYTHRPEIEVTIDAAGVSTKPVGNALLASAMWGTTARCIENMIIGVATGYAKKLELNGVGYRMNLAGDKLNLALGFSHPVVRMIPKGLSAVVEGNTLTISGIDKQQVGQFTAEIRGLKPVEPYKGKGFRYFGEIIRLKEGKKASA